MELIRNGVCNCGCGGPTDIAKRTKHGTRKGEYFFFIQAHSSKRARNVLEFFWNQVNETDSCWLWTGYCTKWGYGVVRALGLLVYAHRFAWELHYKERIPDHLQACHTCDVRNCVNPAHLFIGTNADNVADMVRKGRTTHGEKASAVKLTFEEVKEIIRYGEMGCRNFLIAQKFDVKSTAVWNILNRRTWRYMLTDVPIVLPPTRLSPSSSRIVLGLDKIYRKGSKRWQDIQKTMQDAVSA